MVGAGLVVWGLHIGLSPLGDNSFFTHLATGRLILAEGSVPSSDPYTFTAQGEPWVVQSWLASLAYGAVERVGGVEGLRVLLAVVTAALVAGLWALARPADGLVARLVVGASAVAVGATMWTPRPLLFGLLLLAATLLVVERHAWPYLLVPVFWLWANVHGSFPLGLLVLVALAVGARLDGEAASRELHALLWAAVGTLLGALSPIGPQLLWFPVRAVQDQEVFRQVIEWQSPDFSGVLGRVFLVQVIIAVAALVRVPRWRRALPMALVVVLALTSTRNIAVASVVLVPLTAGGLSAMGSIRGSARGPLTAAGAGAVGLLAVVVVMAGLRGPSFDLDRYPVDAVAWMGTNGLLEPEQRRVTVDIAGNYLEMVRGSDANVSQDDRVDMFPDGVVDDYVTLVAARPGSGDVLDRLDPDAVLWRRGDPLTAQLLVDPRWRLAYQDSGWVVFLPR